MAGWTRRARALGLLVLTWLVRRAEPQLAFFPTRGEDQTPRTFGVAFAALDATTRDGERIRVWHLPRAGRARADSSTSTATAAISRCGPTSSSICSARVSTSSPSTTAATARARAARRNTGSIRTSTRFSPSCTRSSAGRTCRSCIGDARWARRWPRMPRRCGSRTAWCSRPGFRPCASVLDTNPVLWVLSWFSTYEFPTARWMSRVRAPTLVIHGDRDSVIPYRLASGSTTPFPGRSDSSPSPAAITTTRRLAIRPPIGVRCTILHRV